jgi:dienelactone hydrolase
MAEVLLFHHVMGLTPGVVQFADELRAAGHAVHTPDLFDGKTFGSIDEGMAYEEELGTETILARGTEAAEGLPEGLVYMGMSLGVVLAQKMIQTRPGARGAVLFYGFLPPKWFGPWPEGVPAQIHVKESDPFVLEDDALEAARELASTAEGVELFVYPGDSHYFADSTHPHYDEKAAALAKERVLSFLADIG